MTYLYFIQRGYGCFKIGVSDNPETRLAQLQTASDKPLRLVAKFPMPSRAAAFDLEKQLHTEYAYLRLNGEWFRRSLVRHLKFKGKRIIGGTPKNPLVRTTNGWMTVDPPRAATRTYNLRDLAVFRE